MPKRHKKLFFAKGQGKKTGTKIGQFASPDSLIDLYPIYNDFSKGLQADFTAVQNAFLMHISNGMVEGMDENDEVFVVLNDAKMSQNCTGL
jgi:transposase